MLEEQQPTRLDNFVHSKIPNITRSMASKIIEMKLVSVNGETNVKSGYKVKDSDKIVINYDEDDFKPTLDVDIPIIFEDDNVIVINKPIGLLVHSKGNFNKETTVETWLKNKCPDLTGPRAGIVHRLDRATSGVMILAKNLATSKLLTKQFANRKVKKEYVALVKGLPKIDEAIIDVPIERNPKRPQSFRTGVNGKQAQTNYKVLEHNDNLSIIELKPVTGRTHQLRVHLAHIGCPIVGDPIYGNTEAPRMYLHALSLEITIPGSKRMVFNADLPSEFNKYMKDHA